jgi:prepilin-type N-terminal cleavage/methylation domain-containing protein
VRRSGFTLIEILIVVGIIAIMLASAVMSVASGRGAVHIKEATRGVVQLSRYASALALLRQRPVVVTFHRNGKVEVRISGEATGSGESAPLSDPIYLEVNGEATLTAAEIAEEEAASNATADGNEVEGASSSAVTEKEKKGFFYTRQALNPEELAKEDAEGVYEGVTIEVEVLGEDGEPLPPELAAARSLRQPERKKPAVDVFNSLDINSRDETEKSGLAEEDEMPVSVTYETNGSVNPHRIIIRAKDASAEEEGFAINISQSGKAVVGECEEEEQEKRRRSVRVRRR